MNIIKQTPFEKASFNLSQWLDTSAAFDLNNITDRLPGKAIRKRAKAKIWSKRLELFFGFIPALLVFVITYGRKFK